MKEKALIVGIAAWIFLGFTETGVGQAPGPAYVATKLNLYAATAASWRTDHGFQSTIRLKNVLAVAPLDVSVTLYMADGTPLPLPIVHLGAAAVVTIAVNQALATASATLGSHVSQSGSAVIAYRYDWAGAVLGTISILDTVRSLQFINPFIFADEPTATNRQNLINGMWWKYSPLTACGGNTRPQPRFFWQLRIPVTLRPTLMSP